MPASFAHSPTGTVARCGTVLPQTDDIYHMTVTAEHFDVANGTVRHSIDVLHAIAKADWHRGVLLLKVDAACEFVETRHGRRFAGALILEATQHAGQSLNDLVVRVDIFRRQATEFAFDLLHLRDDRVVGHECETAQLFK